jgi:hypothetical protein
MEAEQRRAAKEQMIASMQAGHHWQEAAAQGVYEKVVGSQATSRESCSQKAL